MPRHGPVLGVHVSASGSVDLAVDRAMMLGCTAFQMFTRNPQGWKFLPIKEEVATRFGEKLRKSGIGFAVSHMPYLPNLATPDPVVFARSQEALTEELRRATVLGLSGVVAHLGSHLGKGKEYGQERVASAISEAYSATGAKVPVLLENSAGQKNSVGSGFDDIRRILDTIRGSHPVGVCLDTCHMYASGYDVGSPGAVEDTFSKFDDVIGLERLKLVHLNDSKGGIGCHLDRHENIGKGYIGKAGFRAILHNEKVRRLPMIIETPVRDESDWGRDLAVVRKLYL
ncbi:MAG TPA: deoxyribonuclease IV [Conexivisphaerales archaeon]|nr:deoxyribonuclease IV [Conexivisphaerales archaeon]